MTDTQTIVVAIGRNLPEGGELSAKLWTTFVCDTRTLVEDYSDSLISITHGHSVWDGRSEETRVFVATITYDQLLRLGHKLASLAIAYNQDAIALTVGYTAFLGPNSGGS